MSGMGSRIAALAFVVSIALGAWSQAGETGHYVAGVEGIRAGSVPPSGVYSKTYFVYYGADDLKDHNGDDVKGLDFDLDVFAGVERLIWITDKKFLCADYGMQIVVPLQYTDVEFGPLKDDEFGVGDISVAPIILSWHGQCWDLALDYEVYAPTGKADSLADPGKDFWTHMFSFGGTVYLDKEKTWSLSALGRYEIHSEKKDQEITPGQDLTIEWGLAKTFCKTLDVGVTGYVQCQTTDDEGDDVFWDKGDHDRVFAVGPEVMYTIPEWKLSVSLRHQWEFGAESRSEGHVTCLTLIKAF